MPILPEYQLPAYPVAQPLLPSQEHDQLPNMGYTSVSILNKSININY